jgi:hypothetical protein
MMRRAPAFRKPPVNGADALHREIEMIGSGHRHVDEAEHEP